MDLSRIKVLVSVPKAFGQDLDAIAEQWDAKYEVPS